MGDEAAASSPPRRPVGTGSLPMSEQEAVPDIAYCLLFRQDSEKLLIKDHPFWYAQPGLVFDNLATAKCVAHHPVYSSDEHRR